ncbi:solute carrier family 22 member 4 isoform X1 [Fundulus heteroclitus]|uniref:solute carrier family 22 member 4 isoform X1 n=1 Tax=Fundulus heteroclitus TaxID=8078 RepID=UPI00165ADBBC|nr:solute carrier family 22 member 4 isoform X1 [Fundulus heteroclitus]
MQDYEEAVSFLGSWGPFQRKSFLVLCLATVPCGYNLLSVIFLLASPPHHCDIPAHSNLSQEWIQASIPVQQVAGQPERSSCSRYELDLVRNLSAMGASPNWMQNQSLQGSRPEVHLSQLKQEGCKDGWTYSTEYFQSTVVTEFDLVCSEQWKQPLTSLTYFLGGLVGCFVSGIISDRIGRKPVLFGSIAVLSVFSTAMAFAPSWPVFIVFFFMLGMGQLSCYIVVFVLGTEILVGSTRIFFSSLGMPLVYVIAMMLLTGTAYLVRSWRHLSLMMAVPGLACIPLWWMVPESPRWLLSQGRVQEAELLLRSAALKNRVEAPPVIFLPPKAEKAGSQKAESVSFLDLLKTANIRHITVKLWLIWFSTSVSYYGLSFSMSTLNGNPFLNYFLLTVVEVPAYFACYLAARCFPRRLTLISFSLLGALALLLIQVTVHSNPTLTLILVLLGKIGVLVANAMVYTYTGELTPTVIRNTAMSSCAMFSRVGSSVSPYLLETAEINELLPWIIAGALSLFSVLLCIFLPETFRQPLPDTIEQMPVTHWFAWPCGSKAAVKEEGKFSKEQPSSLEIICTTRL